MFLKHNRYLMIEPAVIDGQRKLIALERRNLGIEHKTVDNVGDDRELKILLDQRAWPINGDFTYIGRNKPMTKLSDPEDVKELFVKCEKMVDRCLRENVYFSEEGDLEVVKSFIFATYFTEHFRTFPRLVIHGTTESGKSRLQKVIRGLSYRGIKVGNTSFAAAFRMAHKFGCTLILEEAQDLRGDNCKDILSMFKEGFQKEDGVTRYNKNTDMVEHFEIYSPMIFSTKNLAALPEDVINRAFTIEMIQKPDDVKIEKIVDENLLFETRQALHHLMLVVARNGRYYQMEGHRDTPHFDFVEHISNSDKILSHPEDCPELVEECGFGVLNEYPPLDNRQSDIAMTMLPIATVIGNTKSIMEALGRQKARNKEFLRKSFHAEITNAWTELVMEKNPKSKSEFLANSLKVSTRDIHERVVENDEDARLERYPTKITTRSIGSNLTNMGFHVRSGGTGNKTYVERDGGFDTRLETTLRKYALKELVDYYENLPGTTNSDNRTREVN